MSYPSDPPTVPGHSLDTSGQHRRISTFTAQGVSNMTYALGLLGVLEKRGRQPDGKLVVTWWLDSWSRLVRVCWLVGSVWLAKVD